MQQQNVRDCPKKKIVSASNDNSLFIRPYLGFSHDGTKIKKRVLGIVFIVFCNLHPGKDYFFKIKSPLGHSRYFCITEKTIKFNLILSVKKHYPKEGHFSCLTTKAESVALRLQGLRLTSISQKDSLMLRKNSNVTQL